MQLPVHDLPDPVKRVAHHIAQIGGKPYIVGGAPRDKLVGKPVKDYDFEVYGVHPDRLKQHLSALGDVKNVGKSFGVFKLNHGGEEFDVAVPRREHQTGPKHTDVEVEHDPHMPMSEAASRRDFTINSMMWDPFTGHVHDPHGGVPDLLHNKTLRHTDPKAFSQDALRVLRGAQFAARFGLKVDPETLKLMQDARHKLHALPPSRVGEEWNKLLIKGQKPSLGMDVMKASGALETLHPELHALEGIPQDPEYHPEGDVWTHTKNVVDRAAEITRDHAPEDRKAIMYAALLHDIAKPHMTEKTPEGRITSHGHEEKGREIVDEIFQEQFETKGNKHLRPHVASLVGHHLRPTLLHQSPKVSDKAIRKLAKSLHPASIENLVRLAHADHTGRGERGPQDFPAGEWLLQRAQGLKVHQKPLEKYHIGHFVQTQGIPQGKQVGYIQGEIDKLQEKGVVKSQADAEREATRLAQEILSQQSKGESLHDRVFAP